MLVNTLIHREFTSSYIAKFVINIRLADELGSGVRRLYRCVPRYSGKPPEMIDGDVFRIIVPLDDSYSFDEELDKVQVKGNNCTLVCTINCTLTEKAIREYLRENPAATQTTIAATVGKSLRTIKKDMAALQEKGLLEHEGARENGCWIVKQ